MTRSKDSGRTGYSVLTILFVFILFLYVSYIFTKYSDFGKIKNYSDFQKIVYTKTMAILDNLDNQFPLFESESSTGEIKIFSDCCSNGCTCQGSHDTEFVQDVIDFEQ